MHAENIFEKDCYQKLQTFRDAGGVVELEFTILRGGVMDHSEASCPRGEEVWGWHTAYRVTSRSAGPS